MKSNKLIFCFIGIILFSSCSTREEKIASADYEIMNEPMEKVEQIIKKIINELTKEGIGVLTA